MSEIVCTTPWRWLGLPGKWCCFEDSSTLTGDKYVNVTIMLLAILCYLFSYECFNPLTAGAAYIRIFIVYYHNKALIINM